jgi:hypothetical protein
VVPSDAANSAALNRFSAGGIMKSTFLERAENMLST